MLFCASTRWLAMSMAAVMAGAGVGPARAQTELPDTPSFARVDTSNIVSRSLPSKWTDLTELSFRRWVTRGRADIGAGFGSVALIDRSTGMLSARSGDGAAATMAVGTMLMLGLRYRTTEQTSIYADAMHLRGLGLEGEDRIFSKVGVEFKAAQSDWKIVYGGLGFQLAGDARMTLKLRRGGLGITMHSAF